MLGFLLLRLALLVAAGPERRFVQHDLVDRQSARRSVQHESRAGGVAVNRRGPAGLGDERTEVFDLALDRVRRGVTALAAAAPVVVDHGEMPRQLLGERAVCGPALQRPADQDHRVAVPESLEGDRSPVPRQCVVFGLHGCSSLRLELDGTVPARVLVRLVLSL